MEKKDAEALRTLSEELLANKHMGVEFKVEVKVDERGDHYVNIWNSSDQSTDRFHTVHDLVEFFRTKFMLVPAFCYHRGEYRNPKDDATRPFICPHCERLNYSIDLESSVSFTGSLGIEHKRGNG